MHRRHQHTNVPTEIVRTIAVIAETGSFSKAGLKLGLSQPAISAQVKRLQVIAGGPVFQKGKGGGLDFTPRGRLLLTHARKLLDANDQILSLGGATPDSQPVRLGLSALYAEPFLENWKQGGRQQGSARPVLHVHCDNSGEIANGLAEGFLDIACLFDHSGQHRDFVVSWDEPFVWARARDFVMSPGMPIPLIGWPAGFADFPAIKALERDGLAYRVVFESADHHARIAATAAGIGLVGLPARQVKAPLIVANEYYLPAIAPVRAGIALRHGCDQASLGALIAALRDLAPGMQDAVPSPRRNGTRGHAVSDDPSNSITA